MTTRVHHRDRAVRWAMVLPIVVLYAVLFVWPIATVVLRSLNEDGRASIANLTLDHYRGLFTDSFLLKVQWRTLVLALTSTVLTTLLAFPTAYFLSRLSRRVSSAMLLLILLPFWASIVVRLFALTSLLSPNGLVNDATNALGLGDHVYLYTQAGTLIGTTMYLLPFMVLVLLAGMKAIDPNLQLAAQTMGASPRYTFRRIYLPLVRPSLLSGVLLCMILGLGFFLVPSILGGPTQQTISVYIQQQIDIYQWGTASAMGITLLVATVLCYVGVVRVTGSVGPVGVTSTQVKGVGTELPFRWTPTMVGAAVATVISFVVLLAPMLLVFPLAVGETGSVVFPPRGFTMRWFGDVFDGDTWTQPLIRSLYVGLATAVLSTLIALILARRVRDLRSPFARSSVSGLAFAPIIAPVILLAIGIYSVELQLGISGTFIGLVLAHTVIAAPLAYALIANAISAADPGLEQAAWILGASRTRAFWTVVVRGMLPSVLGAMAIAFVTSWDEVVIALFLQTGPIKTLPVTIFRYIESGIVPTVPAVASLLVLLVIVLVVARLVVGALAGKRRARKQGTLT